MNTPAHLIFGMAVFGKPNRVDVTAAALLGALIPDLSLYLMAGWHLLVLGTSANEVFGVLYFSDAWQSIFRIDNSMVLWGIALVLGLMLRAPVMIALCGAVLLHLCLDFALHHDDGRAHFWPITNWIFQSPLSYWDGQHYGNIVGPVEMGLSCAACVWMWHRFTGAWTRGVIVVLGLAELLPGIIFAVIFR